MLSETADLDEEQNKLDCVVSNLLPHAIELLATVATGFSTSNLRIDSADEAKKSCEQLAVMRSELIRKQRTSDALKRLYRVKEKIAVSDYSH